MGSVVWESTPPLAVVQAALLTDSPDRYPVGQRMRAAYYLRQYYTETKTKDSDDCGVRSTVLTTLTTALLASHNNSHGSLLRHEFAYVLGQLQDSAASPALEHVLADPTECVMVRHEAAEALGAIGSGRSTLESIVNNNNDVPIELVDTCRLSLSVMDWRANPSREEAPVGCACLLQPYSSIDPAPPHPAHVTVDTPTLGALLRNNDNAIDLFERYRAMFSLRNRGGHDAVLELCTALLERPTTTTDTTALLRHEVAYVLGQLQHPASVDALASSLADTDEHFMVRHESAEALGAIMEVNEECWTRVREILSQYADDASVVVRESCAVALDAAEYWAGDAAAAAASDDKSNSSSAPTTEASNELPQKGFAMLKATKEAHFNVVPKACQVE